MIEFFKCEICHLDLPMSQNALGLKEIPICHGCYKKDSKKDSQVHSELPCKACVEINKIPNLN